MRGRAPGICILLALAVLVLPGCSLLNIPVHLARTAINTLFFWAAATPETSPVPARGLPIDEGLARAMAAGPAGPVWLIPEGAPLPPEAAHPPAPGLVPVRIRVRSGELRDARIADGLPHGLVAPAGASPAGRR